MTEYDRMLQCVANYYGAGSEQWYKVLGSNYFSTPREEVAAILKQTPYVETYVNEAGEFLGYSCSGWGSELTAAEATAATAANAVNSNVLTAEAIGGNLTLPANCVAGTAPNTVEISSGATAVATGSRVGTVLGHVGTAVVGAGIGMKLGVWIDGALYNANPEFWDSHNLSELNPETWSQTKVTNWLYNNSGYDDFIAHFDENGQMYVDEKLFGLYAKYLAEQGAFEPGESYVEPDIDMSLLYNTYVMDDELPYRSDGIVGYNDPSSPMPVLSNVVLQHSDDMYCVMIRNGLDPETTSRQFFFCSEDPFTMKNWGNVTHSGTQVTCKDGSTVYVYLEAFDCEGYNTPILDISLVEGSGDWAADLAYLLIHGTDHEGSAVPGINPYDTVPTGITPTMTIPEIINLLKQQYPQLWDNAIKQGTLNDDGTITDRIYVPVAMPTGGTAEQPTTDPDHPGAVDPSNEPQTKYATKIINPTPNPTPDPDPGDTGTGNTPAAPLPTGSASALYKIYNPTEAQIQSFGAWLWSTNFVDQLLKIFNDPMQAIISLHKIYATPHTGGTSNIKVGYLDSGVASKWVDQQYIDVDCGTVKLLEKNANVFDYAPFVDVRIYLPFVGIVPLDVADVMRGTIGVKYRIDVITGTLIATVSVSRDAGAGGVMYQYTGSMAENYPLSSGSYMGIVTGMLGLAAGIAGTVATGGAAAPALLGGAAGLTALRSKIEHSNGFSGNAGALACKKPYLIISRQQTAMANGVDANIGMPTNSLVRLDQCSGMTKVKAIHLRGIHGATDGEQDEIIRLLTEGVLI